MSIENENEPQEIPLSNGAKIVIHGLIGHKLSDEDARTLSEIVTFLIDSTKNNERIFEEMTKRDEEIDRIGAATDANLDKAEEALKRLQAA